MANDTSKVESSPDLTERVVVAFTPKTVGELKKYGAENGIHALSVVIRMFTVQRLAELTGSK